MKRTPCKISKDLLDELSEKLSEMGQAIDDAEGIDWDKVLDFKVDLRGLNNTRRDVSKMTPAEQIERLATQRNLLRELLDRVCWAFPEDDPFSDALYKMVHEIMGNTFMIEGINEDTKDVYEVVPAEAAAPYVAAAGSRLLG